MVCKETALMNCSESGAIENVEKPKKNNKKTIKINRTYTRKQVLERLSIGKETLKELREKYGLIPLGSSSGGHLYFGLNIIEALRRMALGEVVNGKEEAGKW